MLCGKYILDIKYNILPESVWFCRRCDKNILRTNMTLTLWKSVKMAWPNFRLSLLGRIGIYGIHIRHIYSFDRIIAPVVIWMTLVYFCAYDTHLKKKTLKPISRRLLQLHRRYRAQSYSSELSCRADGICDLDLCKKVKTPWPAFPFSGPTRQWFELECSYMAEYQMWGSHCSLCFLANLDLLLRLWHTFK